MTPSAKVYPFHSSRSHAATADTSLSPQINSEEKSALDIWEISRAFPERWAQFLNTAYTGNIPLIMMTFKVSEKAVRNWLAGKGGVRTQHSMIGQLEHPDAYADIILTSAA